MFPETSGAIGGANRQNRERLISSHGRVGVSRATLYRMIESGGAVAVVTGATKNVPVRWIEHHLAGGATKGDRIIEATPPQPEACPERSRFVPAGTGRNVARLGLVRK